MREVVTGQKEGRPVRYAQIVASYRNGEGKPRHRVILSLGRVDRLNRGQLEGLMRALGRYLGRREHSHGPRVGRVRDLGMPWVVTAAWRRMSLPDHLALEASRHGLPLDVERGLLARVLGLVACPDRTDGGRDWLSTEVFPATPDGEPIPIVPDGDELLAQAGPELERTLFLRRAIPDGRLFAAALPHVAGRPRAAIACDGAGHPMASQVARNLTTLGRRLYRRLRDLGARDVVWGPFEGGDGVDLPPEVSRTVERVHRAMGTFGWRGANGGSLESARIRLTSALLAGLVMRRLELDAGLGFDELRRRLQELRAVEICDGDTARWEPTEPSPAVAELLSVLDLGDLPSALPVPGRP